MKKKIILGLIILLALMQFKGIDRSNPPVEENEDFFAVHESPTETRSLIQTACYDCHSHTTEYPWYSHVAPISWWLRGHIDHAREKVNFSTWSRLDNSDRLHALKECQEVLIDKEMPMLPYMIAHREAWLDEEERQDLAQFFQSIEASIKE
ncbi:MAG: heme-binding domain-containing protein [Flavobacteriales bacterium]|nr:heme-binding domain-containing protein [Flavobacteriales bacterium]